MNHLNQVIIKYRNYVFLLLLIIVYLILDYQTIMFLRPQGIHFIRQTDSLSFVANYFKNGFNFFQPQVFNLQSNGGKAICEFPLLYYITALLYLVFGEHEFILRFITIIIVSSGFLYLFKLLYLLLRDFVYASAFSLLVLSSTVLLYYTNNFLPDASALGFALIGWYFFIVHLKNRAETKALLLSFLFFTLASLLKVTYFVSPIAAILSLIVIGIQEKAGIKDIVKNNVRPLIHFLVSLMIVAVWNLYVLYYNKINHDTYFLIRAMPIWSLGKNQVAVILGYISEYWYSKYYYQSTFHFFFVIITASILFIRKAERIILIPTLFLAMGSTCYFLLFFAQFKEHDYYFIALIPTIMFLVINSFIVLKNKFPRVINHYIPKLFVSALCILSLNYARQKLFQRYDKGYDMYSEIGYQLADTRHYLDLLGIPENAKIIIITDQSPNGGLYFINRPGWNLYDTSESGLITLRNYIQQGAEYILFTGTRNISIGNIGVKMGEYKGVVVYKL